jgi:hypothetical protein
MNTEDGSISEEAPASSIVSGKRRTTPFDMLRNSPLKDDDDLIDEFIVYNEALASRPRCVPRARASLKTEQKRCQCLHVLSESVFFCEAVAQYQLNFGRKKREDQQRIVIQSMQSSLLLCDCSYAYKYSNMVFPIPFILSEDDCMEFDHYSNLRKSKICRDALVDILGLGRIYWSTCLQHALNNTLPDYKLKGRTTNRKRKWDATYFDSLVVHFEELRKEAVPIATRFVRERTGETTTRDDNEKVEALPPSFTKRQCYYNYCASRGVKVTSNNKGCLSFDDITG